MAAAFETNSLSFCNLEELAEKYGYNMDYIVYFKIDDRTTNKGVRVVYSDNTVRDLV